MTYAELIKHLWRESGLQINEYAERVGYSTAQVSLVLNGHQAGTLKMVVACVAHAGRDIQDFLCVPESAEVAGEKRILQNYKSLNAKYRAMALQFVQTAAEAQAGTEKSRSKRVR